MTRQAFIERAIRDAERRLGVPSGWWGTWRHVTNGWTRVRNTGRVWRISAGGRKVSDHDSRSNAIRKAVRL